MTKLLACREAPAAHGLPRGRAHQGLGGRLAGQALQALAPALPHAPHGRGQHLPLHHALCVDTMVIAAVMGLNTEHTLRGVFLTTAPVKLFPDMAWFYRVDTGLTA